MKFLVVLVVYLSLSVLVPLMVVSTRALFRSRQVRRVKSCRWCGAGLDMESGSVYCSGPCELSYSAMREELQMRDAGHAMPV